MTPSESVAMLAQVSFLTEQWRATSLTAIWSRPGDWHGPATEQMVTAVTGDLGVEEAAGRLGADRGARGVGLEEGLGDLLLLFQLTGLDQPPFAVTRAFAAQWVESFTARLVDAGSTDALTGLATRDYLLPRVREVYADARGRGIRPDTERCLIVIDRVEGAPEGWQRVMREAKIARVLSGVLDRGQTNSVLPSGTFLSLALRDSSLDEDLVRIRRALSAHGEPVVPPVRIEALPPTIAEAEELLRSL